MITARPSTPLGANQIGAAANRCRRRSRRRSNFEDRHGAHRPRGSTIATVLMPSLMMDYGDECGPQRQTVAGFFQTLAAARTQKLFRWCRRETMSSSGDRTERRTCGARNGLARVG
jgi:hypothetical protein